MIYLNKLQLKDFVSHKESEVDFGNANSKIAITGKSGHGKSSLVNAILFAFYGDAKVDNASLIRKGQSKAVITLSFNNDDKEYVVEKTINKTGQKMSLWENGIDITQATNKDTQKYLEDNILKTSLTLFKNSVFAMQDDANLFVHETPAKRKDILMEIVDTYNFDELYDRTVEKIKDNETDKIKLNGEISQLNSVLSTLSENNTNIEEVNKDLVEQKGLLESYNIVYNGKIAEKNDIEVAVKTLSFKNIEKNNLELELNNILKKGTELKTKIEQYSNLDKALLEHEITTLNGRLNDVQLSRGKYNEYSINYKSWQSAKMTLMGAKPNLINYDLRVSELMKKLSDTQNMPDLRCEFCGKMSTKLEERFQRDIATIQQEIDATKSAKEIQDKQASDWEEKMKNVELQEPQKIDIDFLVIEKEYNEIMTALNTKKELLQVLSQVEMWKAQKDDLMNRYTTLNNTFNVLKLEVASMGDYSVKLEEIKQYILLVQANIYKTQTIISDLNNKITSYNERLKMQEDINSKMVVINKELLGVEENIQALETLKIAFGNNGIRTLILDDVLPMLEQNTNEILSELSDFRIKFDTQKESSKGDKKVEGLFITIINDQGEELDFNSYSGGEQNKIIVSIQQALAKFSHFGFMIQDELIAGLDTESIDNFSNIMLNLKEKNMQIVSISHLSEIKDLFEDQVFVEKRNGVSVVYKKLD